MQTRVEFQRRHVLLQTDAPCEVELSEANSGCPQCRGIDSGNCWLCKGRQA